MKACSFTIVGLLGLALFAQTAAARDPWVGKPAYGREVMSRAEINEYWDTLKAFETFDEKLAFWLSEIDRVQQRALEWGVQLPDPPKYRKPGGKRGVRKDRAPYFSAVMTPEEVEQYYATLSGLTDTAERHAFKADHIMRMRARGFERGISVPSTSKWNYVFENGQPPPDVIP
jgi:hypothetical protein